jgi:hypothetical protein
MSATESEARSTALPRGDSGILRRPLSAEKLASALHRALAGVE